MYEAFKEIKPKKQKNKTSMFFFSAKIERQKNIVAFSTAGILFHVLSFGRFSVILASVTQSMARNSLNIVHRL